ncbi:MAG: endolytic transglycosylase MltG [Christensenellales bacterium]|nr:endolytic transglycosylase MltG [Christensenellales bacterium]
MAKKKKRPLRDAEERELIESRRYGFFWYDWIWRVLRPILVFVCSFVIICGLVYTGWQKVDEMFFAPTDSQNQEVVSFSVKSGSSLSAVSKNLEAAGLIHNHTVFKYMADFMGMGQKIQSGDYELTRAMSATEILNQLISGDGKPLTMKITIIPGWTVEDVANYLVEIKVLSSADEFLSLCKSGEAYNGYYFIEEVMKTGTVSQRKYALEGYLSPNTYEIYTSSSADTLIKRLLTQTEAAYLSGYDERAQELGLTMDEVFTLASMIEKEAKTSDFAKVSAVFHNRLKADMTLGSDVTVKYASGSQKMSLNDSDLAVDSPYNTYTHKGLPVGPICNPSMDAVVAALYPDEQYVAQKYLYFCSAEPESGKLVFSKTLEEHNKAVSYYRQYWEEYDKSRGLN